MLHNETKRNETDTGGTIVNNETKRNGHSAVHAYVPEAAEHHERAKAEDDEDQHGTAGDGEGIFEPLTLSRT